MAPPFRSRPARGDRQYSLLSPQGRPPGRSGQPPWRHDATHRELV